VSSCPFGTSLCSSPYVFLGVPSSDPAMSDAATRKQEIPLGKRPVSCSDGIVFLPFLCMA
jgi:hypothetical protein